MSASPVQDEGVKPQPGLNDQPFQEETIQASGPRTSENSSHSSLQHFQDVISITPTTKNIGVQ